MKKIKTKPPTNFDVEESIDYIWAALSDYRKKRASEGADNIDDIWETICSAMSCIQDRIGMKHEGGFWRFYEKIEQEEK